MGKYQRGFNLCLRGFKTQDAVVRNLEIIDEASDKMLEKLLCKNTTHKNIIAVPSV